MNNYTYTYACRNIFNTIKTSGHSSLEKYTSYFIERVVCERELETEQKLQHIDPQTLLAITAFLSRSPGLLNRGPRGPASAGTYFSFQHLLSNWSEALNSNCSIGGPDGPLCWVLVLSKSSYLQLSRTSCAPSYIIVLRPLNSTRRQSRLSPDILNRMHRVILLFYAHSIQTVDSQGYPLTSSTGCTCYLHRCISYFDSLAGSKVNIQHLYLMFLGCALKINFFLKNSSWPGVEKTAQNPCWDPKTGK